MTTDQTDWRGQKLFRIRGQPQSPQFRGAGGGWRIVQSICRLKAVFLGRRLQAAVAAGAAVAAVPGGA